MEKKKRNLILGLVLVLLLLVVGVTYAFFTYESGTKSDIVTGQIYMNYEETSTISLTGVFPETKAQALARQDENGVFEFTITGRNTSKYPVYYEIDLLEGGVMTGKTEQSTKILPEHVMIYLEKDGVPVIEGKTYADWNNKPIYVETVPAGTTSNIEHKYTLRMWISDKITISDTDPNADYTTEEWNDAYTSLKVRVVGDFEYKEVTTDVSCFAYNVIQDTTGLVTYDYPIITLDTSEEKVEACMANMMGNLGEDYSTDQDGYQSFCEGIGTVDYDGLYDIKISISSWYIGGATLEEIQEYYPVVSNITTETRYFELNTSEEGVNSCITIFTEWWGSEEEGNNVLVGETYESFCNGTGTVWGNTFIDSVNDGYMYYPDEIDYFVKNNVFTQVEELPQVIEITNYDEETCGTDVIIPSQIEDLPVTRIADGANYSSAFGSKGLTDIVIPNTMTYIGSYAFNNNPLVNVKINGNPVLGEGSFVSSSKNAFQTFQYGGTCEELNQYNKILMNYGYEPQSIITSDTYSCTYTNYANPK